MPLSSHAVTKIFRNCVSLNQNRNDNTPLAPNQEFGFDKDTNSRSHSAIISSEPSYADINDKNTGEILSICSINQNVGSSNNNMMINENLKESTQKYVANRAIRKSMNRNSKFNNPTPKVPSQVFPSRKSEPPSPTPHGKGGDPFSPTPKQPNIFSDSTDHETFQVVNKIRSDSGQDSNDTRSDTVEPCPPSPTFENP
jgi:hypothetical protein